MTVFIVRSVLHWLLPDFGNREHHLDRWVDNVNRHSIAYNLLIYLHKENLDRWIGKIGATSPYFEKTIFRKLKYIQDETYRELDQQVNDVKTMLNSFIQMLTANG